MSIHGVKQVRLSPGGKGWRVIADDKAICEQRTKEVALDYAIKEARREGKQALLQILKRDGTVQEERGYGVRRS